MQVFANPEHAGFIARQVLDKKIPAEFRRMHALGEAITPGLYGPQGIVGKEKLLFSDADLAGVGMNRGLSKARRVDINENLISGDEAFAAYPKSIGQLSRQGESADSVARRLLSDTAAHEYAHQASSGLDNLSPEFNRFATRLGLEHRRAVYNPGVRRNVGRAGIWDKRARSHPNAYMLPGPTRRHHELPQEMFAYAEAAKRAMGIPVGGTIDQIPKGALSILPYVELRSLLSKQGVRKLINTVPVAAVGGLPLSEVLYRDNS